LQAYKKALVFLFGNHLLSNNYSTKIEFISLIARGFELLFLLLVDSSCYSLLVDSSELLVDSSVVLVDSSMILPEGSSQVSLPLERDLTGIVHFLFRVKWYQSFGNFSKMTGDNDGLQDLSTMIDTTGRRDSTIKSTLDRMAQAIEGRPPRLMIEV